MSYSFDVYAPQGTSTQFHVAIRPDGRVKVACIKWCDERLDSVEQDLLLDHIVTAWNQLSAWAKGQLAILFPQALAQEQLEDPDVLFYLNYPKKQEFFAAHLPSAHQYLLAQQACSK